MSRWIILFVGGMWLAGCGSQESTPEPVAMPKKEKTWVKTEEVELTKEAFLAKKDEAGKQVTVDDALKQKLMTPSPVPSGVVKDPLSCETAVRPLETKRKELQRAGGMWHAFERAEQVRPHSDTGMQLDSKMNKLVFALVRLCGMSDGTPMTPFARDLSRIIDKRGEDGTRKYLSDQGRPPKVIENWLQYVKDSKAAADQKIPFADIEEKIRMAIPLMQKYEELYGMEVTDSNKNSFVQEGVTLLAVLNERIENVPELVRALKEDAAEPQFKFEGEM